MLPIPRVSLRDGREIPQVGFGVFLVPEDETEAAVSAALEVGYRHVDTAAVYENERGVGRAVAGSGLERGDIFVTSKCWNSDQGYDEALAACETSLEKLRLDYLDLYLVHWPTPKRERYVDTWRALEKLQADGLVRSIGVSNFQAPHLRRLMAETETVPAVNQIEMHPWLQQRELRAFHAEHGIVSEAWSPLAQGGDNLADPVIGSIAEKHNVSPAQIILRWHLDIGNVVIPKSVQPKRMASNIDLFAIRLDEGDLDKIAGLDSGTRVGPNPDEFNQA
ncbi:MAG: aldo/keto reductase [Nocardioidaceae bacterium]